MKSPMSSKPIQPNATNHAADSVLPFFREGLPLTVRQAAIYLGVRDRVSLGGAKADSPPARNGAHKSPV